MSEDSKFFIKDSDVPKQWYNLVADLKEPMSPPLHPGTKQPIGPDDLAPLFPMELIMQEVPSFFKSRCITFNRFFWRSYARI